MSFLKSKGFKYVKNLIIGLGAAVVLLGALFKLESWPYASEMLIAGLCTEAFIFAFLGIVGPEKDYYWEKLYPGLDEYGSKIQPLAAGPGAATPGLNGEVVPMEVGRLRAAAAMVLVGDIMVQCSKEGTAWRKKK